MTINDKLNAIQHAEQYKNEVCCKIKDIIKNIYNPRIREICAFGVNDDTVDVRYSMRVNGGLDDTFGISIPRVYFNEGFDIKPLRKSKILRIIK